MSGYKNPKKTTFVCKIVGVKSESYSFDWDFISSPLLSILSIIVVVGVTHQDDGPQVS